VLRKNEEKNADEEEKSELEKHDEAAGDKRGAAVALVFCGEQALHDGLVRAMTSHREKRAADEAGPERVFGREAERKIEELKLVARNSGDLRDFIPAAGDA